MEGDATSSPDDSGDPTEPKKPNFLERFSLTNLWRVLVIAVLGLAAGFGGLDAADPATPVALGDTYDNGPLQITPHSVFAVCATSMIDPMIMKALEHKMQTQQMLALSATVTNTDKINVNLDNERKNGSAAHREVFTLTQPADFMYYGDYSPGSGFGKQYSLPPRKSIELLAIWGVPFARPGLRPGDKVSIRINDIEWRADSAGELAWRIPKVHASYGQIHTTLRECDS